MTLFSLLAVLISLSGVFGLVFFETSYRRGEIVLRKIHGSSVNEILTLFTRRFVVILAIGFIVAAPAAWFALNYWLDGFPYRTQIPWWCSRGARHAKTQSKQSKESDDARI